MVLLRAQAEVVVLVVIQQAGRMQRPLAQSVLVVQQVLLVTVVRAETPFMGWLLLEAVLEVLEQQMPQTQSSGVEEAEAHVHQVLPHTAVLQAE